MDVYKIQTSLDVTGNITRELRAIFASMENIERAGQRIKTTVDSWGGSIQRIISEVNHLAGAMGRLHSGGNRGGFSKSALGFDAKAVMADVAKIQQALGGVRNGNGGASRSFSAWATSLERSATAAERLERALAGVRAHSPGGSPVRVSGGGASGGGGAGRRGGHRNHRVEHEGSAGAAFLGVGGGIHTAEKVLETGIDMRHIEAGMRQTGANDSQLDRARSIAFEGSRSHPNLSPLEIFEHIGDLRGILGTFDDALNEAPHILDEFSALKAKMGNKGAKSAVKQIYDAVRSAEFANEIDGADVKRHVNTLIKQAFWFGDKLNPSEYFAAQKNAGQMLNLTEDEFKFGAFSALAQGIGQRAGTQFATYDAKAAAGLRMTAHGLTEAERIGLLDPKTVEWSKQHLVKPGAQFKDADQAAKNPFKYLFDKILPAMKKGGIDIDNDAAVLREFGKIYTDKNAYGFLFEMFKQRRKLIKDWDGVKGTSGDFSKYLANDPWAALQGSQAQGNALATALSDPVIPQIIDNLRKFNTGLASVTEFLEKHPLAAGTAAGVGLGVVGGTSAAGITALGLLAAGTLPPIAIAVGLGATVTIASLLIPWDKIYEAMGWKPGIALGGKDVGSVKSNAEDGLPGVGPAATQAQAERDRRRAAGIQGLGNTYQNVIDAQRRFNESIGHTGSMADSNRPLVDRLGDALLGLARKLILTEGVINQISFGGGGTGGGGGLSGLIQRASLGGGGGGGLGGGNGIVPPGITGSDANMLGLISKYESGGRNVMNYVGDRTHTAQGYYQITNSNWRKIAPGLGITAPNAMSASLADQARVAQVLLHNRKGIRNWSDYNPRLRGAIGRGETFRAPSVAAPAPPPPAPRQQEAFNLHVDGQKLASIMTRHQFRDGNRPATGANMPDGSELYPVVG